MTERQHLAREQRPSNNGIGFLGLLAIVFITLKLTGVIDWSWWLVLLPVLPGLIMVGIGIILLIAAYTTSWLDENKK